MRSAQKRSVTGISESKTSVNTIMYVSETDLIAPNQVANKYEEEKEFKCNSVTKNKSTCWGLPDHSFMKEWLYSLSHPHKLLINTLKSTNGDFILFIST